MTVSESEILDATRMTAVATEHVAKHMTRSVATVDPTTMLGDVARLLATRRISGAVVTARGRPVGIISERDIVRAVATDTRSWAEHTVGSVMSQPVHMIGPESTVREAIDMLVRHRIRRLAVVVTEEGGVAGVVTQTDLLRAVHTDFQVQAPEQQAPPR